MAAAAAIQAIISLLGLALVGLTVIYARGAWKQANRTFEREQRARIKVSQVQLPLLANHPFEGRINVRNEGATKARVMRSSVRVFWGKYLPQRHPADEPTEHVSPPYSPLPQGREIAPGEAFWWEFNQRGAWPTETEIADIEAGNIGLWVIGLIRYADTLDNSHYTLFCHAYSREWRRYGPTGNADLDQES